MDNNQLSVTGHCDVTSGKVQGSELCLDMSATRQVILRYKCVHEGCQQSFESTKGNNVPLAEKSWQAVQDIQFGCQFIL